MKNNIFIAIALLFGVNSVFAQKPIYTKAKVETVNVYRNAAQLQNTASVSVPAGTSEIVIGNIANDIDQKSVQIGVNSDKYSILSTQFTNDYASTFDVDKTNPVIKRVTDSIKIVENLITKTAIEIDANTKTIELLDANRTMLVGSNSGTVAQLTQLSDYYTDKRVAVSLKLDKLKKQSAEFQTSLSRLKSSLETSSVKDPENFGRGSLIVRILSASAGTVKLEINYLARAVYWTPRYEIKGTKISEPLQITLKAAVVQSTGLDWKQVKLSLINGNPSTNNVAPSVEPWFLYATQSVKPTINQSLAGKVSGLEIRRSADEMTSSTQVVSAGAPGFRRPPNDIKANELNISYDISVPYDILSNNKEHLIPLYDERVPVDFNYFTAPNYNKDAFLVVKIKDYAKLNLISAPATIVFDNIFVGETYLNPSETDEELRITLGSDRRISVVRENIKEKSGEKFLSSYREKTVTYDLIIRNNKKESINIEVRDRFPLSTNESVTVDLLDSSGAVKDEEKGFLTWNLKIGASETKKLRVSYKVKFPKDFVMGDF